MEEYVIEWVSWREIIKPAHHYHVNQATIRSLRADAETLHPSPGGEQVVEMHSSGRGEFFIKESGEYCNVVPEPCPTCGEDVLPLELRNPPKLAV